MSKGLILVPTPQKCINFPGRHWINDNRFIWIKKNSRELINIAKTVQKAINMAGAEWQLTCAQGNRDELIGAVIDVDPDRVKYNQGYILRIESDRIQIISHDLAGAFYGAQTLVQICRQFRGEKSLPCIHIEDWPDIPHRGVMLDISRDKVPRMETLYAIVDILAELKINQLQLYTEHTFAYRNHYQVWKDASPMTAEEILRLDEYCRERYVELVPNQSSFGHMERWLVHDEYKHLAECPDGFVFPWGLEWKNPWSLSPAVPESITFLSELYDELLPNFTSSQFNVNCDETFDIGQGKSKELCENLGRERVYLDFLYKINDLVQRRGRTMMFWADIIRHYPDLISDLPKDAIALEWGYEDTYPFDEFCRRYAAIGMPFYVCPSTCTYSSIAGRTDNALANLRNAAESAVKYGAVGYLNTDWGDSGHWQHLPISFLGYTYGAAVSWAVEKNRDIDIKRALNVHIFQDEGEIMGGVVFDLGNIYQETGVIIPGGTILAMALIFPEDKLGDLSIMALDVTDKLSVDAFYHTREVLDDIISRLSAANMNRSDADLVVLEVENNARLLKHAASLCIARMKSEKPFIPDVPRDVREELAVELSEIKEDFAGLWRKRNRIGGLADSIGRMDKLIGMYRT